jgi:hypothetical protein
VKPEERVETHLRRVCLGRGIWCLKIEHCFVGFPDRLLLGPNRLIEFVELKARNGKARAAQLWVHGILKRLGFEVAMLHTVEAVDEFLERLSA